MELYNELIDELAEYGKTISETVDMFTNTNTNPMTKINCYGIHPIIVIISMFTYIINHGF